jgi:hypothetical protein
MLVPHLPNAKKGDKCHALAVLDEASRHDLPPLGEVEIFSIMLVSLCNSQPFPHGAPNVCSIKALNKKMIDKFCVLFTKRA